MIAGPLDRRIVIERWDDTGTDAFGETVVRWLHVATVWANVEDIRDSERYRAQQVGSDVTTRFRVRWRFSIEQLNPKDRIIAGGRHFNVTAVKQIGRREGLEITAAARSDGVAEAPPAAVPPSAVHVRGGTVVTTAPTVRTNY